jgi:uncharacterized membrane protein
MALCALCEQEGFTNTIFEQKGLPGYTVNFAKPLGIMIAVLTVAVVFGYCTFIGN